MRFKKTIKSIIPVLGSCVFFYIIFSNVDFSIFIQEIIKININYFLIALGVSLSSVIVLGSFRYKQILKQLDCKINFKEAVLIRLGSYAIIDLFPFKSGEAVRALYMKQKHKMEAKDALLAAFIGYFFDVTILIFFMILALPFLFNFNFTLYGLIVVIILLLICYILSIFSYRNWRPPLDSFIKKIFSFKNSFILFLIYSIFYVGSELISFILISQGLGLQVPLFAIFLYIPLTIIIAKLPISLYGLGTREAAVALFFSQYASYEKLVSAAILLSFVEYVIPLLIGLVFTKRFIEGVFNENN